MFLRSDLVRFANFSLNNLLQASIKQLSKVLFITKFKELNSDLTGL